MMFTHPKRPLWCSRTLKKKRVLLSFCSPTLCEVKIMYSQALEGHLFLKMWVLRWTFRFQLLQLNETHDLEREQHSTKITSNDHEWCWVFWLGRRLNMERDFRLKIWCLIFRFILRKVGSSTVCWVINVGLYMPLRI